MIVATHGIVASQILTVPVATAATSVGDSSFTANWNAYSGANYYLLDVSTSSSFSTFVLQDQLTTSTSYVVTGLSSNTTYYYRVRANVGTDPDAQSFFDRVTTAGGTLTSTEQAATNQLVISLKSYSIWSKMKAIYPMVGASAAACAQNLKSSSFTGTFSGGWTYASTGVTGNGTTGYMNTNFIPSSDYTSSTNFGLFLYTSSTTAGATDRDFGIFTGMATPSLSLTSKDATSAKADLFDYANRISVTGYNVEGFYIGSRTASNSAKLFRNGTSIGSTTAAQGTAPSIFLTLGAANLSASNPITSTGVYSAKTFSFAGTCDGLTDTEASDFYTAVQTFNTTLSRQVS